MLQTIGEFAREQLAVAGEAGAIAFRHARRYAERAREIRDGIEGTEQVSSVERGIAEEANLQVAMDTLLETARGGDEVATELGMQVCGDLWMYWHVRGKNVTAREYATAFLEADARGTPTTGRAGALITAGLASWMLGQYEQSLDEWARAHRIATVIGAEREKCITGFSQALALIFLDPEAGLKSAEESIVTSRAVGFTWAEGIASTVAGILHAVTADPDSSQARHSEALEIQRRLGDWEGACPSGASPSWHQAAVTLPGPASSTGSLSLRSRRSEIEAKRRGFSPRWPGRISPRRPCAGAGDLLRVGTGAHRRGERPRDRAFVDRARGRRGSRAPARECSADSRGR